MLTLADIFESQSQLGVGAVIGNTERVTYESYLLGCRRNINDKTPREYYNWDRKRQYEYTDSLIVEYVRNNLKLVEGFIDSNEEVEQESLIDRLRTDIVDFGILRNALEDDTVQEIQINDFKTIFVVQGGKSSPYVDSRGNPHQFVSNDELVSTINRLIYSQKGDTPRMTQANPLLNARTANKGYRLSGVNSTAITPDTVVGMDFPTTSITLRKYSSSRLGFEDFERFGTLVPKMSKFTRLASRADLRILCVGPTSSGKTTLLNAMAWELPEELRVILIQNPTEIMLYDRDPVTRRNRRNTLHWEAEDLPPGRAESPTSATMANLVAHSLRNTPDVVIPGELRTPLEFLQANRVIKTGHRMLTSIHSYGAAGAVSRFAAELSELGGSQADHTRSLANQLDIIYTQKKLEDGSRRVMAIEELTGRVDPDTGLAEANILFKFTYTGEVDIDPTNPDNVLRIHGYFEQVSPISDRLIEKFYAAGITRSILEEFITVPAKVIGASNLPSEGCVV